MGVGVGTPGELCRRIGVQKRVVFRYHCKLMEIPWTERFREEMVPCHLLCGLPSIWGCFSVLLLLYCVSIVIQERQRGGPLCLGSPSVQDRKPCLCQASPLPLNYTLSLFSFYLKKGVQACLELTQLSPLAPCKAEIINLQILLYTLKKWWSSEWNFPLK